MINLPLILHPTAFAHSFDREMDLVVHGQQGVTRRVPHALYLNIFRDNSTPVMWVLLVAFLAERWRERRTLSFVEWLLIAFPFAYTLVLSFSPKTNDRYFLPATGLLTLFAAIGALDAGRMLRRWLPLRWVTLGAIVALVGAQMPSWLRYEIAFQHDDNRELLDWVRTQVPEKAVIAKDSRILLPDPENSRDAERFEPLPQTILAKKFAADVGTIDALRKMGVTHVAVSETDYGRFFLSGVRPRKDEAVDFERRKAFYTELLRDGDLIFQRERGTVLYLHPGIRLYRMPPGGGAIERALLPIRFIEDGFEQLVLVVLKPAAEKQHVAAALAGDDFGAVWRDQAVDGVDETEGVRIEIKHPRFGGRMVAEEVRA